MAVCVPQQDWQYCFVVTKHNWLKTFVALGPYYCVALLRSRSFQRALIPCFYMISRRVVYLRIASPLAHFAPRYKRIFVIADSYISTLNPQTFEETHKVSQPSSALRSCFDQLLSMSTPMSL